MSDNPTIPLSKDELEKAKKILECCYAEVLRAVIKNGRVNPGRGYAGQQGLGQAPVMPGLLKTVAGDIATVGHLLMRFHPLADLSEAPALLKDGSQTSAAADPATQS